MRATSTSSAGTSSWKTTPSPASAWMARISRSVASVNALAVPKHAAGAEAEQGQVEVAGDADLERDRAEPVRGQQLPVERIALAEEARVAEVERVPAQPVTRS